MNHSSFSPPETRVDSAPRLIIPTCNHILRSGRLCRCAASRGQRFCRHHADLRVRRLRVGRAQRLIRLSFRMPLLEDMAAVRLARTRVRYALEAGHIDPSMAPLLSWALRQASGNIRYLERQARWELEQQSHAGRAASEPPSGRPLSPSGSIKYPQPLKTRLVVSRTRVNY